MKQFIVDRHTTPNTPTLEQVPTDKIPIYATDADAEADLANLSVGQIIGITDTGDELAQPVNVVEEDNLHAVTSSAVYNAFTDFTDITSQCTFTSGGSSVGSAGFTVYKKTGFVLVICDGNVPQSRVITLPSGVYVIFYQYVSNSNGDYFYCSSSNEITFSLSGSHYTNLSALFVTSTSSNSRSISNEEETRSIEEPEEERR